MKKYLKAPRKALIVGLCGLSLTSIAFAAQPDFKPKTMHLGVPPQFERTFTIPELTILVKADLLRNPNSDLTLKGIYKTKEGSYKVTLTDSKTKEDQEIEINKFGFNVDGFDLGGFHHKGPRGDKFKGPKGGRMKGPQFDEMQGPDGMPPQAFAQGQGPQGQKFGPGKGMEPKHGDMAKPEPRELTADEVKTVVEARMIRMDISELKVGKVTETENGYTVTLLAEDNSLVKRLQLNKSGFPERPHMPKKEGK